MDCILFHYVRHKPVDLSHLTTTGGQQAASYDFLPQPSLSCRFSLRVCTLLLYLQCKHLTPLTMRRQIVIMLLGLMTTLSLPAFAIAGSRESNHAIQPYKYIGKELDHGLEWYDHGARHYDPVTGRWNVMDALAEKYYVWSHDERASEADGLFSKKMGGLPVLVIGKDEITRGFYYDFNDGKSFGFGNDLKFHELNILSLWLNQHRSFFLQVK